MRVLAELITILVGAWTLMYTAYRAWMRRRRRWLDEMEEDNERLDRLIHNDHERKQ